MSRYIKSCSFPIPISCMFSFFNPLYCLTLLLFTLSFLSSRFYFYFTSSSFILLSSHYLLISLIPILLSSLDNKNSSFSLLLSIYPSASNLSYFYAHPCPLVQFKKSFILFRTPSFVAVPHPPSVTTSTTTSTKHTTNHCHGSH